ncbi:protein kinase [Myxococcota bacterium]|nr:protein kinase [Myxococcota bacterium]
MSPQKQIGEIIDDRYEIEAFIGAGGVGEIYRALDHRLEYRRVAVKLLKPNLSAAQVARFRREALLTGALSSPHLVRTSDFGTLDNGQNYLVMEHLDGETLADYMEREVRVDPQEALQIIDGVLAGLESAHQAGVVHRDLKPENIFLLRDAGVEIHVKILDFGFARLYTDQAPSLEVTGNDPMVVGTVNYMAPEQLRGGRPDKQMDIYATAVILFHMLTGQLPYPTKESAATVSAAIYRVQHLNRPPRRLSEVDARFPMDDPLEQIIHQNLALDPAARMSGAAEFRAALAQAMGQRARARPKLPLDQATPWSRPKGRRQAPSTTTNPSTAAPPARRPLWHTLILGVLGVLLGLAIGAALF